MSSSEPVDQKSQLLTEEASLVQALVDVRWKMNSLLPIARLPPDILEQIFYECIPSLLLHRISDEPLPKHLIACTQACRSWREIAIETTALWRVIDMCALSRSVLRLFLTRSCSSPLSIQSLCSASSGDPNHVSRFTRLCTEALRPHMHRIHSVSLHESSHIHAFVPGQFGLYEGSLRHLSLSNISIHGDLQLLKGDLGISRLRSLALDGVVLPWDAIGVQDQALRLNYLSLRNMRSEVAPSLQQLHSILSSSPDLRVLALERVKFKADDSQSPSRLDPVSLPNLQDLRLSFSRSETVIQLLHLLLPDGGNSPASSVAHNSTKPFTLHIVGLPTKGLYTTPAVSRLLDNRFEVLNLRKKGFQTLTADEATQMSFFTSQTPRELLASVPFQSGRIQSTHIHAALSIEIAKPMLSHLTVLEIGRDVLSETQLPMGSRPPWSSLVAQSMTGEPRAFEYLQQAQNALPSLLPCSIYSPLLNQLLSECTSLATIIVEQNYLSGLFDFLTPAPMSSGETPLVCPQLKTIIFGGKRLWSGFAEQWLVPLQNMLLGRQTFVVSLLGGFTTTPSQSWSPKSLYFKRCQGVTVKTGTDLEEKFALDIEISN